MTTEQSVLLQLIRADFTGEKAVLPLAEIDWSVVLRESVSQAVTLSAFESASRFKDIIPSEVYQKWFRKALSITAANVTVNKAQNNLTSLLEKEGFPYVILKGQAAAAYYRKPSNRALGDVDFLINLNDKEKIAKILVTEGYVSSHENHACHIVFKREKEHLEMHFEMSGIPLGQTGETVRSFLAESLADPLKINIGDGEFRAPDSIYHAVILLIHTQHHMLSEGIGLRHLCDFAWFVDKTYQESFWVERLIPFFKSIGLYTFMTAIVSTAVKYLGIKKPEWLDECDNEIAEGIIDDILAGGNFGKKDSLRQSGALIAYTRKKDGKKHGKVYNLFYTLKASTDELYPQAKRYPILYAIYFPYRVIRYVFLVVIGKKVSFHKAIPEVNKRKALYDNLHVFEVNDK